ncbi:hypothetical protein GGS20DRAFT_69251 [Poronia punctata]|nr:hypothetical protein GGS20DRAFT_69251 [Poronia punctata]
MASYVTLTSAWTPASSCLAGTAYNQVIYTTVDGHDDQYSWYNIFGNPTPAAYGPPSGKCLPPSYLPNVPYLTHSCPEGYTAACDSDTTIGGVAGTAMNCCPSGAWSFTCPGVGDNNPYGCYVPGTANETRTGWLTDFAHTPRTGHPVTYTAGEDNDGIVAWAVHVVVAPDFTPTTTSSSSSSQPDATDTPPDSSSSSDSESGLTTGAKAGIGVGVAVGVLAILAVIGLLLRRRRTKPVSGRDGGSGGGGGDGPLQEIQHHHQQEYEPPTAPGYYYDDPNKVAAPSELPSMGAPSELGASGQSAFGQDRGAAELP